MAMFLLPLSVMTASLYRYQLLHKRADHGITFTGQEGKSPWCV